VTGGTGRARWGDGWKKAGEVYLSECMELNPSDPPRAVRDGEGSSERQNPGAWTRLGGKVVWGVMNGGRIYSPVESSSDRIEPGLYRTVFSNSIGWHLFREDFDAGSLIRLDEDVYGDVITHVEEFWRREPLFRDFGIPHKRGILLYGPPGSGKTSVLKLSIRDIISREGVAIKFSTCDGFDAGYSMLRAVQPNIPLAVVMEDLEEILRTESVSRLLNILDGVGDIEKVCFLATTNYASELEERVQARPSRFDHRILIGFPNGISRRLYLEHLLRGRSFEGFNVDDAVADSEDFSFAHLKELFVGTVIFGTPYQEALDRVRKLTKGVRGDSDIDSDSGVGFRVSKRADLVGRPVGGSRISRDRPYG
jgi:hypothetical protein